MSKTQLTIHISRTSVHVAEVFRSNQEIKQQHSVSLLENTPEGYKRKLRAFFDELSLKDEYDEYSLAWSTKQHALVPLSVFNESSAKAVHQLLFGSGIDEKTIDFNRLMELSMVEVYEIPDWVKSFFVIKFPQLTFRHEHVMLLRALFQKNTFKRKTVISLNDEYVNIIIIERNTLRFSNSFEFQNAEDISYHLLNVLEKEGLMTNENEVVFYTTDDTSKEKAEETITMLKKLNVLKKASYAPIESVLKLQTLCV